MSASDAFTKAVGVKLLGKLYKIQKLSVMCIFSIAEEYHLDQLIQVIKRTASVIEDKAERSTFLSEKMSDLPVGYALEAVSKLLLRKGHTPEGLYIRIMHAALKGNHEMSMEEVALLLDVADNEDTQAAFRVAAGKDPSPVGAKSSKSRKRTDGHQR